MGGKSDKVAFVRDAEVELKGKVELGQLEKWAGGTAPDLAPENVYPYRMFATPAGYGVASPDDVPESLHTRTNLEFHEGMLWADCLNSQTHWKEQAARVPLPPNAAKVVGATPCRDLEAWLECMPSRCTTGSLYFPGITDATEPAKSEAEVSRAERNQDVQASGANGEAPIRASPNGLEGLVLAEPEKQGRTETGDELSPEVKGCTAIRGEEEFGNGVSVVRPVQQFETAGIGNHGLCLCGADNWCKA